uniref:Fibronectin type-III domain-containing protein n=1 Tax=Plectus sambesii TaxID=2011161 RepID=A0A914VKM9_9BILA
RPELVGRTKSTSIHIRWTAPSTTGGASITEYEVAMRDSQPLYRGPKTDCQISGLLPGRNYSLRVRAYNRTGHGAWR